MGRFGKELVSQGTGTSVRPKNWEEPAVYELVIEQFNLLSPRNGDVRAYYEGPIQTLGFLS